MVKYDANWEITNTYEFTNSLISVFTDKVIFIYIRSNSNIYWFISIRVCCQWIQTNSYSVTFDFSYYSISNSMSNNIGNFELFVITYQLNGKQINIFKSDAERRYHGFFSVQSVVILSVVKLSVHHALCWVLFWQVSFFPSGNMPNAVKLKSNVVIMRVMSIVLSF